MSVYPIYNLSEFGKIKSLWVRLFGEKVKIYRFDAYKYKGVIYIMGENK